ncbi:hypothetical protein BX666DRAFT_1924890 [Dichotomocladium elegans]|nr:hypothetical protein BX666DRAFT_1924890 [Dichotomocladium elegans]
MHKLASVPFLRIPHWPWRQLPASPSASRPFMLRQARAIQTTGTRSRRDGLPRAASLDSVQSDSPYHFYQTKILEEYVRRPANAATLRQYIFFGRQMTDERLIKAANWVREELLTRLAHRIRDFQQLPFLVGTNPHIEFVYRLYWGAFERLRNHPPIKELEDNDRFCDLLRDLLEDGQLAVPRLALAVTECAAHFEGNPELDRFVNRVLRSRISRRMLAEQHTALTCAHEQGWDMLGEGNDGYVGIIFSRCTARDLVARAAKLADSQIREVYGGGRDKGWHPPVVEVEVTRDEGQKGPTTPSPSRRRDDIMFVYVPEQLEYILFELLSNALRFTMSKHEQVPYPPIQLTVSADETDVYFRVSDQGGGIPPNKFAQLWSYQGRVPSGDFDNLNKVVAMPSSVSERASQAADLGKTHLGLGLPMSRIYAEYWGGELQVMTLEGYGTDAYVRIPRLGTSAENLGLEGHPLGSSTTPSDRWLQPGQRQWGNAATKKMSGGNNTFHPSLIPNTQSNSTQGSDGWMESRMLQS